MKTNAKGIAILHSFESCAKSLPNGMIQAYKCPAGKWTIGWGNTFYENGFSVKEGDVITKERADQLFANILEKFEIQLIKALDDVVLAGNQFSALVSFLYNVGPGSMHKDGLIRLKSGNPSTLLRRVNYNPKDPSIRDEFMKWVSKGSAFEKGLRRRRKAEADLYFS